MDIYERFFSASDLTPRQASHIYPIEFLLPPDDHAYLFEHVRVFGDIECHLATAKAPEAKDH